jgi:hypothetical protein
MDPQRGVCLGCARTLDEIALWGGMTPAEREEVLAALPGRREDLDIPEVSVPPLA